MPSSSKSPYDKITSIDVQLAAIFYPILIEHAKRKMRLTYGDLVSRGKELNPTNEVAQNAIPVSTGRRLDVVRMFTNERNLPDITSLVIGKSSGECGDGFTRSFDPEEVREAVFSFDWSGISSEFDGFVASAKKSLIRRKRIDKLAATALMSEYFYAHRASLPDWIKEHRETVIELIEEGFSPETAYSQVLEGGHFC